MNLERPGTILCFGEMLVRLSTNPGTTFSNAAEMAVHVGGAESNVAAMLGQLGHDVDMVTVLPPTALGDLCIADLRGHGVETQHVVRSAGRLGLYFFEPSGGGGRIIYDRAGSAFATEAGGFDWPRLAHHARWFHLSGINLALGESAASSALAAVAAMSGAGVPVSFDVNHRASLWEGKSEADLATVSDIVAIADVLFASPLDIARLVGTELPSDTAEQRRAAAERAFAELGQLQLVASTRRTIDGGSQQLAARVDTRTEWFETEAATLTHIVDRIGSGDAFAGATIDAILSRKTLRECAHVGLAAAVAKHGIAGDRWIGTREELEAYDPFGRTDVRR